MEHRRVIRFIQLKIEEAENDPPTTQAPVMPKFKAAPKGFMVPKAKSPPTPVSEVNMEFIHAMEPEIPWTPAEEHQEMMHGLNMRMVNLENALHQILEHLSSPTPNVTNTTTAENFPVLRRVDEMDDPWNP